MFFKLWGTTFFNVSEGGGGGEGSVASGALNFFVFQINNDFCIVKVIIVVCEFSTGAITY